MWRGVYMRSFVEQHKDWVHQVGCNILSKKNRIAGLFRHGFTTWCPMGQTGIINFFKDVQNTHFLMGSNKFWLTNLSRKRDDCRIWLLYCGGLTFSDMVQKAHLETYRLHHPAPPVRDPTLLPLPLISTKATNTPKGAYTTKGAKTENSWQAYT